MAVRERRHDWQDPSIHWRRPKTFGRKNPLHVDAQADGALGSLFTGISM
jgi:hypothetical protein